MFKTIQSSRKITAFGGLNFTNKALNDLNFNALIENYFGTRHYNCKYSYSDILISLCQNMFSGGDYLCDLERLKIKVQGHSCGNLASADTIEYACQELKSENIIHIANNKHNVEVIHQLNYNNDYNKALVAMCVHTKQLLPNQDGYTLDYDNVLIANNKQDATMGYTKESGYHPGIAFIGRNCVSLENRNGNTPARYGQVEFLTNCLGNLSEQQIRIKNYRGDSASFQNGVIALLVEHCQYFFIRPIGCQSLDIEAAKIEQWKDVFIGNHKKQVASFQYQLTNGKKAYRMVVYRQLKKNRQADIFSKDAYTYQFLFTNNNEMSEKQVIEFYNQRGDAENSNRFLLNDANCHHLPFPDLATNTVFMYLMALANTLFEWLKAVLIKNKVPNIKQSSRIKKVCFHYIHVAAEWVKRKSEVVLCIYSDQKYQTLII